MKKKLPLLFAIAIVVVACIAGTTMAYLTSSNEIINKFLTPILTTAIYENDNIATGDIPVREEVKDTLKKVQIQNNTSGVKPDTAIDAFIRTKLIPSCPGGGNVSYDLENNKITLTTQKGEKAVLILGANWNQNWFFADGMFYHKAKVAPGNRTAVLLEKVTVSSTELWQELKVDVLSEGIQAEGGAAPQVWGVTIKTDGTITK